MMRVRRKQSLVADIGSIGSITRSVAQVVSKSRLNYWASYVTDSRCPLLFAYLATRHHWNWPSAVFSFLSGWIVFSLVEYSVHRWLLHAWEGLLFRLHESHHDHPEEPSAFFFPTSIVTLTMVWLLLDRTFRLDRASFFICGVASGYCYFGILHHLEHTTRINRIPFRGLQRRWAAHSVHHCLDHNNFGVVTSFWDCVFKTHQSSKKRQRSDIVQ